MSIIKALVGYCLVTSFITCAALDSINMQEITRSLNIAQNLPTDISFCIADLKYSKKHGVRICELGQGLVSGFAGHQLVHGPGKIWGPLWAYLKSINVPVYFLVANQESFRRNIPPLALHEMLEVGGTVIYSLKQLPQKITTPSVIVPFMKPAILQKLFELKKKEPKLIILDEATRSFVLNKLYTHIFFAAAPEATRFRPQCLFVSKQYSPTMHTEIMQQLNSNEMVIKPVNAWKGDGIIMTNKADLANNLTTLFGQTTPLVPPYKYWNTDTSTHFLIENLVHSDPITINNKKYDATMRVAYVLTHIKGEMNIHFLGSYWKLPDQDIAAYGSLESKFKSHIGGRRSTFAARVDAETYAAVTKQLEKALLPVYARMLAAKQDTNFVTMLKGLAKAES